MSTAADAAIDAPWPERRFSQAIAEGDGISLIPTLRGDVVPLAVAAEAAGAESVLLEHAADVATARAATSLPVVVQLGATTPEALDATRADGADGVVIAVQELVADGAASYRHAVSLGLDCAVRVADEGELEVVLEALEPEIFVAAVEPGEEGGLAILTDVPAGKLMIVAADLDSRDDVVALERAGVDGLVIGPVARPEELAVLLRELIGAEHPLD